MESANTPSRVPIRDLVLYYLRLGALGFGGPVALVGQMEKELVQERKWLTKEEMREGIAVCQSMPGPLAIQVGIYISYLRGGFWGAWAGGWAFILPNFVIVATLGALYSYFGGLSPVTAIFYGVAPAVIALILSSCYSLAKLGMEDWLQWAIAAVCFVVTVAVQAEVALLFLASGIVGIAYYGSLFRGKTVPSLPLLAALGVTAPTTNAAAGSILGKLLLFFLKAGSLTFGSGLVIVPFLEKGLVQQTGWLDERQFLIAVAMGMISPGPVVITATFVGYLVGAYLADRIGRRANFIKNCIQMREGFVHRKGVHLAPMLITSGLNSRFQVMPCNLNGQRTLDQEIKLSASYLRDTLRTESIESCYLAGNRIDDALSSAIATEFGAPVRTVALSDFAERVPEGIGAYEAELTACTGVFA